MLTLEEAGLAMLAVSQSIYDSNFSYSDQQQRGKSFGYHKNSEKKISGGGPGSSSRQSQCSCSSTSRFDCGGVIKYMIRYSISILSLTKSVCI